MKQRLLLALLMLLTSAGFMKVDGQTIRLAQTAQEENVTITFTSSAKTFVANGITGKTASYPQIGTDVPVVSSDGSTASYTFKTKTDGITTLVINNAVPTTSWGDISLTIEGKVSQFITTDANQPFVGTITSLKVLSTELTNLNLAYASNLLVLDVSGCTKLATIDNIVSASKLQTLNASGCGFVKLMDISSLTGLKVLDLSKNQLTGFTGSLPVSLTTVDLSGNKLNIQADPWDLTSLEELTSLKLDGNTIRDVSVKEGCSVDFGTQDFTGYTLSDALCPLANKDLDLNKVICTNLVTGNVTIDYAESWKKLNDKTNAYEDTSDPQKTVAGNDILYRFFDSNKVYVHGKYECVLVSTDGFKYRVRFTVKPANVSITRNALANGAIIKAYTDAGQEIFDVYDTDGDNVVPNVDQGLNLKIDIDFSNASGYELSTFALKGLEVIDGDLTKRPIKCRVAAKYVSGDKDEEPYIDAEIVGKDCKITFNSESSSERGYCQIFAKDAEGKYTKEIENNQSVAYGTEIRVVLTPTDSKYTPTLTINGNPYAPNKLGTNGQYFVDVTVQEDMLITASFGDKTSVRVGVMLDGIRLDKSTHTLNGLTVEISGSNLKSPASISGSSYSPVSLLPGGDYQLKTAIQSSSNYYIKYIIVGGQALNVERRVAGANDEYFAEFTAPSTDADICIVASELVSDWGIVPLSIVDESENAQIDVYTGNEWQFAYKTDPAGMNDYVSVEYQLDGANTWTTDAPKSAGTYNVQLVANPNKDAKKAGYLPLVKKEGYKLIIEKATPTFNQVPTVSWITDKYVITGATKPVEGIEGSFSDPQIIGGGTTASSHVVEFTFTPDDNTNYKEVKFYQKVQVGTTANVNNQQVTVDVGDGLKGAVIMNADAVRCNSGDSFVSGTELFIYVYYPQGIDPAKIKGELYYDKGTLSDLDRVSVIPGASGAYQKVFKYVVPDDSQGESILFTIEESAKLTKDYKVNFTPKSYEVQYSGTPQTLVDFVVNNLSVSKEDGTPIDRSDYSIAFKQGDNSISGYPVNVGTYQVEVTVPASDGYKSLTKILGIFTIKQATPDAIGDMTWPTALPVLKGKTLAYANLTGGVSTMVPGSFQWKDKTVVPEDGKEYPVIFVPTDTENYASVKENPTKVTVLDITIPILMVETPLYGAIKVTDGQGNIINSGDNISGLTSLVITATPAQYFTFGSLTVNGKTYATQTVSLSLDGKTSVEVSATFNHIEPEEPETPDPEIDPDSQYTITLPTSLVGAKLSKTGVNSVKRGGSFSFSVSTLAADASKVVVKVGNVTIKPSSSGVYTLSDITSNYTVSVSLPNPTEIKLTVPTEYKNAGGYLMGRVQVQGPRSTGKFYYNDEVTLIAFPESGVKFAGWTGDVTGLTQVKEIVLTKDLTVKASFSGTPTGIEDIMAASITTGKGCVWVRGIANADVTIVSIAGRVQAQERISGDTRIDVPAGIYVVVLESGSDVKRVKVIVK